MSTRRGFTVIEVIIAIILIAAMSAAVIPALMGRIRDAQTAAISQTVFALSQAVFEYRKAVTLYPPALRYLAVKPIASTTDACGTAIGTSNANNWRGPYVSRELVAGGINIGDAAISDTLRRVVEGTSTYLFIDVAAVDSLSVVDIERQFDATFNGTTGTVRFQKGAIGTIPGAPNGTLNMRYGIPITGC